MLWLAFFVGLIKCLCWPAEESLILDLLFMSRVTQTKSASFFSNTVVRSINETANNAGADIESAQISLEDLAWFVDISGPNSLLITPPESLARAEDRDRACLYAALAKR